MTAPVSHSWRRLRAGASLAALVGILAAPGLLRAQTGGGTVWVALDAQPAGTPARIVLNTDLSGPNQTYFDVFVSGFYATTRVGPDGRTYQELSVPGLPSYVIPGEPRVPIVRADLGIVTDAPGASFTEVTVFDRRDLPGYLAWPSPIPAQIHDGTPAQFVRNEATYGSALDFPSADGIGGATRGALGGIPASLCTAYPMHWNPASGILTVAAHVRYAFSHSGGLTPPMNLTMEHADAASVALLNWGEVSTEYGVNYNQFQGSYLFVCPSAWMPTLAPLIQQKKTRGFSVTVVNVPLSGETCPQLKQAIQNWYAATRPGDDHYCLLVGSTGSTPYCFDQNNQLSDKVLSSVNGDGEPEIFLGRLFVASQAELQNQVKKILDYETGPQVNNDGNVLLVAHHQQDQDFDFVAYQESVRTASYAQVTPNFATCYGTNPALGNTDISNQILGGVGLVAYMGHGDRDRWLHWSFADASFTHSDAAALANGPATPVLWSIACQTGDPRLSLSLASGFMKNAQGGAVGFYGAVDQTYGPVVQVLNDSLFQAVYGRGITRHGQAIALAEHATIAADSLFGFDAVYKYLLYGDPEMAIKRHNPGGIWAPIDLLVPISIITPCPGVDCCPTCPAPVVDIQVHDASGAPVPGVKVGLWKPSMAGSDQVLENRYSGPDGWVHIPAPRITAGTLYVGFDDGDGRAGMDSIDVQPLITDAGGAEVPRSAPLRLTASPNLTSGSTRLAFGRPLDRPAWVRLFRADGRLVRELQAARGAVSLDWDGCDRNGRPVATGLYLAQLQAGATRLKTRVIVVR
jgi:peptidase C25-like protein